MVGNFCHIISHALKNNGRGILWIFCGDRLAQVIRQCEVTPHVRQGHSDREANDRLRLSLGHPIQTHGTVQNGIDHLRIDSLFMQVSPYRPGQLHRTLIIGNNQRDKVSLLNERQADGESDRRKSRMT